jgi:hypothetical protein
VETGLTGSTGLTGVTTKVSLGGAISVDHRFFMRIGFGVDVSLLSLLRHYWCFFLQPTPSVGVTTVTTVTTEKEIYVIK